MSTAKIAHAFGPSSASSKGAGHPVLYGDPMPAQHFDAMPDGGGYPHGFLPWAFKEMGCQNPNEVLHLCSGSMRTGIRVDVRASMQPTVVADCRRLPFPDESFDYVMADPPYSAEYALNLYDTAHAYPEPFEIVTEACRVLRPGGRLGLLHFMVPYLRKPMRLVRVYGLTQGLGYNIRAWSLLEKSNEQASLFAAAAAYTGDPPAREIAFGGRQ